MRWAVWYKNRQRTGLTSVEAEDEVAAARIAAEKIERKYHWLGPVTVTSVTPARVYGDSNAKSHNDKQSGR